MIQVLQEAIIIFLQCNVTIFVNFILKINKLYFYPDIPGKFRTNQIKLVSRNMVSWVHLISGEFTLSDRFTGFSNMQKIKKKDKSIGIFYSVSELIKKVKLTYSRTKKNVRYFTFEQKH